MKPNVHLDVPLGAKRVLLHACCAPCSSAVVECLMDNGIEPVIFYSNSNIFPKEEYDHRLNECIRYARKWGIPIVDDVYDHGDWGGCAAGLEDEPERGGRCLQCFKYRRALPAMFQIPPPTRRPLRRRKRLPRPHDHPRLLSLEESGTGQ